MKHNPKHIFIFLFLLFILPGCAVMVSGSKQMVVVKSNTDSATVFINGEEVGNTPYTFKAKRREAFPEVTLKKKGYKTTTMTATTKTNELVYMNFVNIFGWVIDYGVGANRKFVVPDTVYLKEK